METGMKNNSAIWNDYTAISRIPPSSIRNVDWALTNIPNFSFAKIGDCRKIKFGGAGFLLDTQTNYAIFGNCRYVLDQEEI